MNNHGLSNKHLDFIKNTLVNQSDKIQKVALFGSRANGSYKKFSDIDLVIYGDISESVENRLYTCFHESLLPYKVDIKIYQLVNYQSFKKNIDENARILYTHEQLYKK